MLISKTFFRTKRCHKENDTCIDQNVYICVIFFLSTSDNTLKKKRTEHSYIRGNVNCLGRHLFLKPEPEQF